MSKNKKVGITGLMGSGKSEVSKYLTAKGYQVLDCDLVVADLYRTDKKLAQQLQALTSISILDADIIDKLKLKEIYFNDKSFKTKAQPLIHQRVIEKINDFFQQYQDQVLFVEVPLLFESHLEFLFDEIIVVDVKPDVQMLRLEKYRKMSISQIEERLRFQMPRSEKLKRADVVFDNNDGIKELHAQIDQYLKEL